MATRHADLSYVYANDLLQRMTLNEILQLCTESLNADSGVEDDSALALNVLDSVGGAVSGDLSEAGLHIAFVVLERLKTAEATVNSFVGKRYAIPAIGYDGSIPFELIDPVLSIARYRLFGRRVVVPDEVVADYDRAMEWLALVSSGTAVVNVKATSTTVLGGPRTRVGTTDRTAVSFSGSIT